MIKKRILAFLCAALLLLPLSLGGCARAEDEPFTVVCTVFPIYDWVRNIVGDTDGVEVVLLVRNGTDLHSYQPTAADMVRIASCDLLIRVGGDSDTWVEEAAARNTEGEELVLASVEGVTLREISAESLAEPCEDESCEEESHEHGATDEHLWLSLRNAKACVTKIAETLERLREGHEEPYAENGAAYAAKLQALDDRFAAAVAETEDPRVLFADRFPFVYLIEEYGIRYMAAFEGCTTDTNADFETIVRLADRADAWQLKYILVTESSDGALAGSVIAATERKGQTVEVMNSLQSVTEKQIAEGVTYLSVMEENLTVLRRALAN